MGILSKFARRKKAQAQGKETHGRSFENRRGHAFPTCPDNVPQHVKDQYEALKINSSQSRKELDVLRQTRGQRDVGSVKVPVHLQGGEVLDDRGGRDAEGKITRPEKRGTISRVLGPTD